MFDRSNKNFQQPEQTDSWESVIRDAGDYVRPGDQLRGRILDAVSNRRQRRQRWQRYFGGLTLATVAMLFLVMIGQAGLAIAPRGRSTSDLHDQATRRAVVEGVAWEWALTEVVYDWRRSGAAKSLQYDLPSKDGRSVLRTEWVGNDGLHPARETGGVGGERSATPSGEGRPSKYTADPEQAYCPPPKNSLNARFSNPPISREGFVGRAPTSSSTISEPEGGS